MLRTVEAKENPSKKMALELEFLIDMWHVLPETWTELGELM